MNIYIPWALLFLCMLGYQDGEAQAPEEPRTLSAQINQLLENTGGRATITMEEAQEMTQQVRHISKKNQHTSDRGYHLFLEGLAYYYEGKSFQAGAIFEEVKDYFWKTQDSLGLSQVLFQQGLLAYDQGEFEQALEAFLNSLHIREALKREVDIANTLNQIGWVNFIQDNYDKAHEYYTKAMRLYKSNNKPSLLARSYSNLAIIYDERDHDLDKALEYQLKGLAILEEAGDPEGLVKLYNNLGILHKNRGEYAKSVEYYDKVLAILRQSKDQTRISSVYHNLGMLHHANGKYDQALDYYQKSLAVALDLGQKNQVRRCYKSISETYEAQGNHEQALEYSRLQADVRQEIYNETKARQIEDLQARYETEKKEKKIQLLTHEKALARSRNRLYVMLIILAIVLGGLFFWFQRYRHRRNLELADAQLQNQQLKQEKLNAELEASNKTLAAQALQMIQKNNLMQEVQESAREVLRSEKLEDKGPLKKLINLVDYSVNLDKEWEDFRMAFEHTHPNFFPNLKENYPDLTPGELKLCTLIRLNLNLKEAATILGISPDSVKTARYRLRKKLALPKEEDLTSFLIKI